jgi:hypothetical protein
MHRNGLPPSKDKDVLFRFMKYKNLSVAEAYYFETSGPDVVLCQTIVAFTTPSEFHVVRNVRFQKTDADVPAVTTWSPIDIADVNEDGKQDVILEGDSYEDHWLEVLGVPDHLTVKTIFSGLGYYL